MDETLKQKILSNEFQERCWKVLAEILEDKYNQKIKVIRSENEKEED